MKYLFIIQGEGRGHMTQAMSLAQVLEERGHVVTAVYLGISPLRTIPGYIKFFFGNKLKYFRSPNFIKSSDKKGINILLSFVYNLFRGPVYIYEIFRLSYIIRRTDADKVINFYDMIGGLAYCISFSRKPYFVISHHYFFSHPDFVYPGNSPVQKLLLKLYSKFCALRFEKKIALSFSDSPDIPEKRLNIIPPLIRKEVFSLKPFNGGYILVYLLHSGFIPEIKKWVLRNPGIHVIVFTDMIEERELLSADLTAEPLSGEKFIKALAGCDTLVCTSGFETVAEAAYFGKNIFVIPSANHYEQECNAMDAGRVGFARQISGFYQVEMNAGSRDTDISDEIKRWYGLYPEKIIRLIT